jgi:hypothetical protein
LIKATRLRNGLHHLEQTRKLGEFLKEWGMRYDGIENSMGQFPAPLGEMASNSVVCKAVLIPRSLLRSALFRQYIGEMGWTLQRTF